MPSLESQRTSRQPPSFMHIFILSISAAMQQITQKVSPSTSYWRLTKLWMWYFTGNKFEVSGIYVRSCKDLWQITSLQHGLMLDSVNDVFYKQHVTEFLDAEKESDRNIHQCLYNVYGRPAFDRSTVGWWVKWATASETGEIQLHDLSRSLLRLTAFHIQSNCDFRFFFKKMLFVNLTVFYENSCSQITNYWLSG